MRSLLISALAALAMAGCAEPPPPANTGPESAFTPAATVVALGVTDGWTRATPAGATAAGGYLTINNPTTQPDRLVSITSPRSPRVELHDMASVDGVMQMRQVDGIDIPAADSVALAPGGLHVMFMDLSAGFVAGETVPLELTFAQAGVVNVMLEVRPVDAAAAPTPTPAPTPAPAPTMETPAAAPADGEAHNH